MPRRMEWDIANNNISTTTTTSVEDEDTSTTPTTTPTITHSLSLRSAYDVGIELLNYLIECASEYVIEGSVKFKNLYNLYCQRVTEKINRKKTEMNGETLTSEQENQIRTTTACEIFTFN